jgi:subtilisin family serine protease
LFAPAEAVVGASGPNTTDIGHSSYFYDAQYKQNKTNGTSVAAPLVTGVAALAAQLNPHMTPAQMREYITTKCVSENQIVNWGETGPVYSATDYANRVALNGSPNKFLFNPFGTVETYKVGS